MLTDGWLGVTALTVAQDRTRTGAGGHLMDELMRWARRRGEPDGPAEADRLPDSATDLDPGPTPTGRQWAHPLTDSYQVNYVWLAGLSG